MGADGWSAVSWVKIDDQYPLHPKVMQAGESALALDVCGWCYSARYLTDGFIPEEAINALGPIKQPRRAAQKLVSVGRWRRDDDANGWWIHDYLEYNPTRESVLEERAAARARMAGLRSNKNGSSREVRANNDRSSDEVLLPRTRPVLITPLPPQSGGIGSLRSKGLNPRAQGTSPRQRATAQKQETLDRIRNCPSCAGRGFVLGDEGAIPCSCREAVSA